MKQYIQNNKIATAGQGWAAIEKQVPIYEEATQEEMMQEGYEPKISHYETKVYKVLNPTEQMLIDGGYIPYEEPIEEVRAKKIKELMEYDASPIINSFFYQGMEIWISRDDRMSLMHSISIEKASGFKTTILDLNGVSITLDIDIAIHILSEIELYAKPCWLNTAHHKHMLEQLDSIKEIEQYDFTTGYPEKKNFK